MQIKRLISLFLLTFMLSACNPLRVDQTGSDTIKYNEPLPTIQLTTATANPSPTTAITHRPILKPTQTITPNPTETPPPTPTQWGGGKGFVLINAFDFLNLNDQKQAPQIVLSLADFQILPYNIPEFQKDPIFLSPKISKQSFLLHYPGTGETKKVLECPSEYHRCYQSVIYGSSSDEWVYVSQEYAHEQYGENITVDLYKLSPKTGAVKKIDKFETSVFRFVPFPGSLKGLLSLTGFKKNSDLIIYDLETQERHSLSSGKGQFLLIGYSPNLSTFFYRITDYCKTELLAYDGTKVATINNSNGIIGWLDEEKFLIDVTANDNPPNCTNTGIAIANRHGLTGEYITRNRSDFAQLSPDGKLLVYTSDCNNQGCKQLMISQSDGSDQRLLFTSSGRGLKLNKLSKIFSQDGRNLIFFDGKILVMHNFEDNQLKTIELYDREYEFYEITFP